MIDWKSYGILPTKDTIANYPTILEVLEDTVAQENAAQLAKNPLDREIRDILYDWSRVGRYVLIRDDELKMPLLMPTSRTMMTFYRGQSEYYEECLPSLYRDKGNLEKETLRSYLQTAEMMQVMWTHPVLKDLATGYLMKENMPPVHIPIMYDGLAQHYGIKTCYLDFTNDIWTAAFFASTNYANGKYVPVELNADIEFKKRFGVLYRLDYHLEDDVNLVESSKIKPIGLQYFNRPGRQCGFVRNMSDVRDLHQIPNVERIYFRHDNDASKLIFTLSQWGYRFLPEDSFADVVETICRKNCFSRSSLELARNIYFRDKLSQNLENEALSAGYKITDGLNASFPSDILKKEWEEWINGGRERYMNDIIVLPFMSIPLKK